MAEQTLTFNSLAGAAQCGLYALDLSDSELQLGVLGVHTARGLAGAAVLYLSPEMALGSYRFIFSDRTYRNRIIAVAVDEAHCILHWGKEFRTLYGKLFRLRLLMGMHIPWAALSATLTPDEQAQIVSNLGLGDDCVKVELPANRYIVTHMPCSQLRRCLFESLVLRPNIFLDCREFDEVTFLNDCVAALRSDRKALRHLVYTRTKEDATRLARAVARMVGQFDNTLGVQLVNVVHGDLSGRYQREIIADFRGYIYVFGSVDSR